MLNKLKKVKFKDLLGIFIFIAALPLGIIYKVLNKIHKKPLWLICELEDTCRDNGYHFFKYIRKNYPQENCYYAINKKCDDYKKIQKYGNIVQYGSFRHWIYYIAANKNISSHKEGNPNHTIFTILHLYLKLFNNRVFLQHGITKDNVAMFYYKNTYFKLFICGAKKEYEYIKDVFGYPVENLAYTGFARFDNLHNFTVNRKKILIMPTWRRWFELYKESDEEKFKQSEYFKRWNEFLNNNNLKSFIEENNYEIIFYPHYSMKKYINCFSKSSDKIHIITDYSIDIQDVLKECALLITDYSSVYMDFAYMKKPIIYYQFDYNQYRDSHLKKGYFDYKDNGFGEVYDKDEGVIEKIKQYCRTNFSVEDKYKERMDIFFELNDDKNCDRIYTEIKKLR